jgi:hypothetical protein
VSDSKGLPKDERIKAEARRLTGIFRKLNKDTKKVVKSLIESAAFMSITLEDLQDYINKNGVISEYQNGENQWGTKKSPEVEIHIAMTKNHTTVMKQLADLLPKQAPETKDDGFNSFVNGRDDV